MHHTYHTDAFLLRWQLQDSKFLTPLDYGNDPTPPFNLINRTIKPTKILTDRLTGAPSVTIRELFWVGFGDLCFIPDQLVRPINNIMKGIRDPIPTAAKRLPKNILKQYFPAFFSGNFSGIN